MPKTRPWGHAIAGIACVVATGCTTTSAVPPAPNDASAEANALGDANGANDALRQANDANGIPSDADRADAVDAPPDDGGGCRQTFDAAQCPGTYIKAIDPAYACGLYSPPVVFSGACGGLFAVAYWYGVNWGLCVYDGVDAGTLVGVGGETDTSFFCNGTSNTFTAGRVPASCMTTSYYPSPPLSRLDASSCPPRDAAASTGVDASDASAD